MFYCQLDVILAAICLMYTYIFVHEVANTCVKICVYKVVSVMNVIGMWKLVCGKKLKGNQ